jgi:hypothetical protein
MASATGPPSDKIIEGYTSALSLFRQVPTDTAVQSRQRVYINVSSPISNNTSPLQFEVAASPSFYYDLRETRLHLRIKITQSAGTDIGEDVAVGLCNQPLSSLFSHSQLLIQKQPVVRCQPGLSSYLAYINTIEDYQFSSQKSFLQAEMFVLDRADYLDDVTFTMPSAAEASAFNSHGESDNMSGANGNTGLVARAILTRGSKLVELVGPIRSISFLNTVDRLLLSQVPFTITLNQAGESFRLLSGNAEGSYKVQIEDARLSLSAYTLSPEVILAHNSTLTKQPAIYPFIQSEVKMYSVPQGSYEYTTGNLFNNEIPFRVRACLVKSSALNGALDLNPFNFLHCDVNNVDLVLDGVTRFRQPFEPDFANDRYTESFLSSYESSGSYNTRSGNDLSIVNYAKGFCFWAFNISGPFSKDYNPLAKYGLLSLRMGFKKALPQATAMIVIGDFHSSIKIDKVRNVLV